MPIEILMPALSPTMESGNLTKWLVKEGDTVSAGDVIAEIETDKATMEVEAVDEGVLGRIVVAEGSEEVPVNQVIALLLEEGEDESALEGAAEAAKSSREEKSPSAQPSPSREEGAQDASSRPSPTAEEGGAARAASGEGARPNGKTPATAKAGPVPRQDGNRIFASPLARRLAKEHGLDLAALSGSGPHGRIVRRDIDEAVAGGAPKAAAAPAEAAAAAVAPAISDDRIKAQFRKGAYEEKPHDGMRRTIARRLVESKQTVPHFYLTLDCDIGALLELRQQVNKAAPKNAEGDPGYKLSVNDFIIKAMALALRRVPMANASWTEQARLIHKVVDVGVAVAVPDGLFTPVIRDADRKPLSEISSEMKDLASRARSKKLKPEEYQGGSTAVSNLGMYGIKDFSAVINPPHGTILAVGAGEKKPVIRNGAVAIATVMSVTLSCDHRAVDGALGAELLSAFRQLVENPFAMLV